MAPRDGRRRIPFSMVNCAGQPGHDPGLQRHHLLPRQVATHRSFARLFDVLGKGRTGFDDFRRNGILLPCGEKTAIRLALPMHRGPHGTYNAMVAERVGQIERQWSTRRAREPEKALEEAYMRLSLLQGALRRRLLAGGNQPLRLSRFDPLGAGRDFSQLDAMADLLWGSTASAMEPFADD
jgi:hypothetical protein